MSTFCSHNILQTASLIYSSSLIIARNFFLLISQIIDNLLGCALSTVHSVYMGVVQCITISFIFGFPLCFVLVNSNDYKASSFNYDTSEII